MEKEIQGIIENIQFKEGISKKTGKPWDMSIITVLGKDYSAYGKTEYKVGDKIQFVPEQKGAFLNFTNPVLIEEGIADNGNETVPVTEVETIGDCSKKVSSDNLKIKTIIEITKTRFDEEVNLWNETHDVKYTQTHFKVIGPEPFTPCFCAVLFYK